MGAYVWLPSQRDIEEWNGGETFIQGRAPQAAERESNGRISCLEGNDNQYAALRDRSTTTNRFE